MEDILVVRDFPYGFANDLLGLPPTWEIEFAINLYLVEARVCKVPYQMAPIELKELKTQLQELVDKGFIQLSSLPWGVSMLFIKNDRTLHVCIYYRELTKVLIKNVYCC